MAKQSDAFVLRKLRAAEGYLELDMPDQALQELDQIEDPGPYELEEKRLRGEALKAQSKYEEAAEWLQQAAVMFPFPHGRQVWQSLSECLRETGRDSLADAAETNAALLEKAEKVLTDL
ncbi:MAG: hypothetical protein GXP27_04715, partial [Planctomycetes bacterium]|nr:hypothetical protein [Planctomycetota bacterium]